MKKFSIFFVFFSASNTSIMNKLTTSLKRTFISKERKKREEKLAVEALNKILVNTYDKEDVIDDLKNASIDKSNKGQIMHLFGTENKEKDPLYYVVKEKLKGGKTTDKYAWYDVFYNKDGKPRGNVGVDHYIMLDDIAIYNNRVRRKSSIPSPSRKTSADSIRLNILQHWNDMENLAVQDAPTIMIESRVKKSSKKPSSKKSI